MTPILTLSTPSAVVGSPFDLTALSGGDSYTVGANGSDWWHAKGNATRKRLGAARLSSSVGINTGVGAVPTAYVGSGASSIETWLFSDKSTTLFDPATGIESGSSLILNWSVADANLLGWGIDRVIPLLGQHTNTLYWLGGVLGGLFTVTASIDDASILPLTANMDGRNGNAGNVYQYNPLMWSCKVRTVNDTNLRIRILRTTTQVNGVSGQIGEEAMWLTPNIKPILPRSTFRGLT